jgi:hypothetical protein
MTNGTSRRAAAISLVLSLLTFAWPAPALAAEATCRGTLGQVTVDNVLVPERAVCTLEGTTVTGNIKVEARGVMRAFEVRVAGNVQGENVLTVIVAEGSEIEGNVQVVKSRLARVVDSRIDGNILLHENHFLNVVRRNVIAHDLQVFKISGGATIIDNQIGGNLQCKGIDPRPVLLRNAVEGDAEGQCRSS